MLKNLNFNTSQSALSKEFGTSPMNVSRWLSGAIRMPYEFAKFLESKTGRHWSEILAEALETYNERRANNTAKRKIYNSEPRAMSTTKT